MLKNYRRPLRFYILSTLIPWSLWLLAAFLSRQTGSHEFRNYIALLGVVGMSGPLLVATHLIRADKALVADVAARFTTIKAGAGRYWIYSILLMPLSIILAMGISVLFGYDIEQFTITGHATFSSTLFPVWLILTGAPVLEELAWHSYGTDCLRQRFSLFTTSIIFAIYWALWHVPLALIQGYYHSNLVLEGALYSINFLISIFPFVILMNWIYYRTGRNIIVTVILHLTANVFNEIFATHPDSKVIQTGLLLALASYLLITQKELFFNKAKPQFSTLRQAS